MQAGKQARKRKIANSEHLAFHGYLAHLMHKEVSSQINTCASSYKSSSMFWTTMRHSLSNHVINAGTASTLAPGQRKVTLGYNAAGDISLITDALGQETRLSNDALGRQTGATDALGYSSAQQYNTIDQPTQSTNALGQNASMTYDAAGRVTAVINPAGVTIESYTHDAQGRLPLIFAFLALQRTRNIRQANHFHLL